MSSLLLACLALGGCDTGTSFVPEPVAITAPASAPAPVPAPSPPALAEPFPGRTQVTAVELFAALAAYADALAAEPDVRRDYERLIADRQLADDAALYRDYVRIRLAFEATRAGGLWGVRWRITDQLPQSDRFWAQWQALPLADGDALPATTASAECDELSALFAVVARELGLSARSEVGLFWPAANHTVAVWTLDRGRAGEIRIVVPTSQIFLDTDASLDTRTFDPWAQASVYAYRRADVPDDFPLPAPLARAFVRAVQVHAGRAQSTLQARRNERERRQAAGR